MSKIDTKELSSLVKLLDDPDQEIYNRIREKLISFGPGVVHYLEGIWQQSMDTLMQERIEDIIHKIQFDERYLWE